MRALSGLAVISLLTFFFGYYGWMHLKHVADPSEIQPRTIAEQVKRAEASNSQPEEDSQQSVTVAGPLAKFMTDPGAAKVETVEARPYHPTESDHVGGSVVGTSDKLLHQTFAVAGTVDMPFEVPAHAYSAKLHGTFRSFIQAGGAPTTAPGDVDFLLLNDQQYAAFLQGHPGDALFSADATHDQEVNVNLPPTMNQLVKYHLIFRNVAPKTGKKVIQAELQIDY
jgi:hypothetical protein